MTQYEAITAYQQADMAVVRCESTLKNSASRKRLMAVHGQLLELTNGMQKIEADISRFQASLTALRSEYAGLEAAIDDGLAIVNEGKVEDIDYIRAMAVDAEQIATQLTAISQDVRRVQEEISAQERQYKEMRQKAVQRKQEFDQLKAAVDEEIKGAQEELTKLTAARDALAGDINPQLLGRYQSVKSHVVPPVARLQGDQCGGCNMSLPSVVVKKVNLGTAIVECENCGRILFASA